MKNSLIIASFIFVASLTTSVWADASATVNDPAVNSPALTSPSMNGAPARPTAPNSEIMKGPGPAMAGAPGDHPCKHIIEACKAAGFTRGGGAGKDMMDCIKPLMHGQTVSGVTGISSQELAACKAKHEERKMHGGGMGSGMGGGQSGMQPPSQPMQPATPNTAD